MKAYSLDLRQRVLSASDAGRSTREVARLFDVSEPWVRRLKQRRREGQGIAPKPCGGDRTSKFTGHDLDRVRGMLGQKPDTTLEQLRERCRLELGIRCGLGTMWRTVHDKLGWTLKKSHCVQPSRTVTKSDADASTSASPRVSSSPGSLSSSTNPGPRRT